MSHARHIWKNIEYLLRLDDTIVIFRLTHHISYFITETQKQNSLHSHISHINKHQHEVEHKYMQFIQAQGIDIRATLQINRLLLYPQVVPTCV